MKKILSKTWLVGLALLFVAGAAHAGTSPTASPAPGLSPPTQQDVGVFNAAMNEIIGAGSGWYSTIYGYAMDLFRLLVGIEISVMGLMWMLARKALEEIIPSFTKKVIMIGFFLFLLLNTQQVAYAIINSFADIGLSAGHIHSGFLSPSSIIGDGMAGFEQIMSGGAHVVSGTGSGYSVNIISDVKNAAGTVVATMANTIIAFIMAVTFFLALFAVAMEYLMIEIEAIFVMAAGPVFLAAGGSRWTVHYAQSYLQYAVAVGVRLLVIELYISLAVKHLLPLIQKLLNSVQTADAMMVSIQAMALVLILAVLAKGLPKIATAMLSGQSNAAGEGMTSAIGKTAAVTAGGIVGGAALAAGGASLVGSGASAAGRAAANRGAGSLGPGNGGPGGAGSLGPGSRPSPSGGSPNGAPVRAPSAGGGGSGGGEQVALNANAQTHTPDGGTATSVPAPSTAPKSRVEAVAGAVGAKVKQAVDAGRATNRTVGRAHEHADAASQISSHASVSGPGANIRHSDD